MSSPSIFWTDGVADSGRRACGHTAPTLPLLICNTNWRLPGVFATQQASTYSRKHMHHNFQTLTSLKVSQSLVLALCHHAKCSSTVTSWYKDAYATNHSSTLGTSLYYKNISRNPFLIILLVLMIQQDYSCRDKWEHHTISVIYWSFFLLYTKI